MDVKMEEKLRGKLQTGQRCTCLEGFSTREGHLKGERTYGKGEHKGGVGVGELF